MNWLVVKRCVLWTDALSGWPAVPLPSSCEEDWVRLSTLRNCPGSVVHEAARPLGKTYPGSAVLCSLE